jgi:hypothetical protein
MEELFEEADVSLDAPAELVQVLHLGSLLGDALCGAQRVQQPRLQLVHGRRAVAAQDGALDRRPVAGAGCRWS